MAALTRKQIDVLQAIKSCPGWRPAWRGALKQCRDLEAAGLVKECGRSAMPPHVVFVLTDEGSKAIA